MERHRLQSYRVTKDPDTQEVTREHWIYPPTIDYLQPQRRIKQVNGFLMLYVLAPMTLLMVIVAPFVLLFGSGLHGIVLIPAMIGTIIILLAVAFFFGAFGFFRLKSLREIPPEPIYEPKPITIVKNEAWRKPTTLKQLEEIKELINEIRRSKLRSIKRG